jgi:D-tyrosyl-tRNA(Tyr) deacylase
MRACVQRVSRARVTVAGELCGEIRLGMLVLLGVAEGDSEEDARKLAAKIRRCWWKRKDRPEETCRFVRPN